MEKQHKKEIVRLSQDKMDQIENLRLDIDNLNNQIERQRQIHSEALISAETEKQQSLLIAQQERTIMVEQNKVLLVVNYLCQPEMHNNFLKLLISSHLYIFFSMFGCL